MTNRTAQEAQNHYVEKMGPDLGLQFAALWQEVVYAHIKWGEFMELYGTNATRTELLNQAAPNFFGMLQGVLFEETLLHIARMTDPARMGKNENLSVKSLVEFIDDEATKNRLVEAIEAADKASDFCRDWRNRHIAHRDLALATDEKACVLKAASRAQVSEALKAIANILNIVDEQFTKSQTYFNIGRGIGGAVSLLYVLDDGMKARAKREERLLRGEFSDEDVQKPL
jgi:hypothetical protein